MDVREPTAGTPNYMAPELLLAKPHSSKASLWPCLGPPPRRRSDARCGRFGSACLAPSLCLEAHSKQSWLPLLPVFDLVSAYHRHHNSDNHIHDNR